MAYGVYRLNCTCGWFTLKKLPTVESGCEACGKVPSSSSGTIDYTWIFSERVAEEIANYTEQKSELTRKMADAHGLMLLKKNQQRWLVVERNLPLATRHGDDTGRAFWELKVVFEGSWAEVTAYIHRECKPIPKHIIPQARKK